MAKIDSQHDNQSGSYARFFHVGFAFVFIIGAFTVGGYVLDRLLGTLPLLLLLGMVVGFGGALYYLYVTLKRIGAG
jgi:F0F1-type ATP synthase assembly protein I